MRNYYKVTISFPAILWAIGLIMLSYSCTSDFEEINTDKNSVATIGPAELPFLFTRALAAIVQNNQVTQNLYSDQYAQYFANTTTYFPTDRYVIDFSWLQGLWNLQYTTIVPQLQTIFEATDPDSAEYALANIWWVYTFHRVTDYWGPIPYSSAGIPGNSVPYDSQEVVYDDFFKRLDAAVNSLSSKTGEVPFGSFDVMFHGDANKWIKFANSLRLRLAVRISNVDPARAKSEAEAAYNAGVMETSPDDDARTERNNLDFNALSRMSGWNEFRMSASMESALKGFDDPRISEYFTPALETGTYEGLRNGLSTAQVTEPENKINANSRTGPRWAAPAFGGIPEYLSTPDIVMSAAESYFLRAEGALLGWNMGGTAKDLYNEGITQSMNQWGVTDSGVVDAYINSANTPIAPEDYLDSPALSMVPVKFDEVDEAVQKEQIDIQKWIALFPDGWEAWSSNRKNRYLKLYPVANSDNPDITDPGTQYIRRVPFLISEYETNAGEMDQAIQFLNGPDKITTPLWWDKN
ncbi:SusD/RagB family nutrient-binding outer membrane lipoprotein [Mariniflexile sp. HMF6888]|uniref:SusD/RagB family nutrient-binding outer membrane lipoprotein n=1 Tax=Mariniflexile sp. HMF6888 TaxID=3373086 RepID=UPI0037BCEE28